jgi:ectoine hydroxylase-related dioxygenase (phytanoyl-CoA dioxygenase family)
MLAMSFGLVPITAENGAVEIVACTQRIARNEDLQQIASRILTPRTVPLEIGDILLRHPWALHVQFGSPTSWTALEHMAVLRRHRG